MSDIVHIVTLMEVTPFALLWGQRNWSWLGWSLCYSTDSHYGIILIKTQGCRLLWHRWWEAVDSGGGGALDSCDEIPGMKKTFWGRLLPPVWGYVAKSSISLTPAVGMLGMTAAVTDIEAWPVETFALRGFLGHQSCQESHRHLV